MYILLIIFVIILELIAFLFAIIGIISLTKSINNINNEVCEIKKLVMETIINFRIILKNIKTQIKTFQVNQRINKIVGIIETVAKFSLLGKIGFLKKFL